VRKIVITIAAILVAAGIVAAANTANASSLHDDGIRISTGA
jgi:hypothetical protein